MAASSVVDVSEVHPRPRTLWDEGRRPGRDVVALFVALLLTFAVADLLLSEGLGLLYDLVFVTLCVGAALLVRPSDFFAVGVLAPLAMLGVVLLLAVSDPAAVAEAQDGVVQATVAGLSRHALALALGYGASLGLLAVRRSFLQRR